DDEKNMARRIEKLEEVRNLIYGQALVKQLELIDALQQLGIEYHFNKEIKDILATTFASLEKISMMLSKNLYATALLFRILREHGFYVSQDEPQLQEDVAHALELPLNRRMRRLHTRWFIDAYKEDSMHPALLELAMLDFNA
uniref:(-)-alpha-terpineol synthase-like n=1 Tax=Elaeis guineensis var. tenera TaxID=51953 RepID=A0A8N4EVA7_ELAGV